MHVQSRSAVREYYRPTDGFSSLAAPQLRTAAGARERRISPENAPPVARYLRRGRARAGSQAERRTVGNRDRREISPRARATADAHLWRRRFAHRPAPPPHCPGVGVLSAPEIAVA